VRPVNLFPDSRAVPDTLRDIKSGGGVELKRLTTHIIFDFGAQVFRAFRIGADVQDNFVVVMAMLRYMRIRDRHLVNPAKLDVLIAARDEFIAHVRNRKLPAFSLFTI